LRPIPQARTLAKLQARKLRPPLQFMVERAQDPLQEAVIDQPDGVPVEVQSERAKDAVLAAFDAREDLLLRSATDAKPMA
jgi:hypothetical protein